MRFTPFAVILALGLSAAACGSEDEEEMFDAVSAEVSERVKTVVNVHWTTEEPSTGYVEYGPTEALGMTTPIETEPATEHKQWLLGLKPGTTYYYRVVAWDGDGGRSDVKSIETGFLPPGIPEIDVVGTGHDDFIVTTLLGAVRAAIILDKDGDIVWFYTEEHLSHYRARLALDGKSVLFNVAHFSGEEIAEDSEILRVSFDGTERESIPIPRLAHDFVEHADGTIAALVLEDREGPDGERVRGNKIVEVDPEGNQTDVWTSWDCFDPAEHESNHPTVGWTFTNALDYDVGDDVYYVSMRNFDSLTRVNRQTAECEWVLGATAPTIQFSEGSATFHHQHQFQIFGDRLLLMDNEGFEEASRVLEYELDFENNIATEVWSYFSEPTVVTFVLGEPTRYPNGDTFINWSTAGQMERVTEEGDVVWKLNARAGGAFGFNTLASSLYTP